MSVLFHAHRQLNTCRDMNGVIPWTAKERFSDRYGIDLHFLEDVIDGFEAVRDIARAKRNDASKQLRTGSEAGGDVQPGV